MRALDGYREMLTSVSPWCAPGITYLRACPETHVRRVYKRGRVKVRTGCAVYDVSEQETIRRLGRAALKKVAALDIGKPDFVAAMRRYWPESEACRECFRLHLRPMATNRSPGCSEHVGRPRRNCGRCLALPSICPSGKPKGKKRREIPLDPMVLDRGRRVRGPRTSVLEYLEGFRIGREEDPESAVGEEEE